MKEYLISFFQYTDFANRKQLQKILQLPDKTESIRFFSHLINCMYKWMARIQQEPKATEMSWWDPVYEPERLETEWKNCLGLWLSYIESKTWEELSVEVSFIGFDGGTWAATPKDIALQLNYHAIHHRAQIQTIIRQQGVEPDFLDYIGTKSRKIG